jgi:adenylylsulfate reductase, subunit A
MALPNKPKGELNAVVDPEIVEHSCDVLIVGGGMAACGTAFEIAKWAPEGLKTILVDKASLERSGAVAQGFPLSIPTSARTPSKTMSRWYVTT